MEFKDHIDYIGRPVSGSDRFRAIPNLHEYQAAQEAVRNGMVAALQGGLFTYAEAEQAFDVSLQIQNSHQRLVTPETARILARLLDMGGTSLDADKPEITRRMASQLRDEADVREMMADLDEITPESFDL